ncbi:MAG TPA: transporter substrate-binding domain-containing protein [Bradyrhizobium sp.]|nr:transporter substrate-binding domain-containing protein [Bradyrhizobium sp.]
MAAGRRLALVALLLLLVATAGAMAQQPIATATKSTLDAVRERGFLICGSTDPSAGFAQQSDTGQWRGFDVDLCRAIATAVFGDPAKLQFRPLLGDARFAHLQTGAIDVISRNASWSMARDTRYRTVFVGPAFFDGQAFMVSETQGVVSAYELSRISVCVLDDDQQLAAMREFFFLNQAQVSEILYEDREDLGVAYRAGLCQAISAPASVLYAIRRELPTPTQHRILPERISSEAFGPVVREGDEQWFSVVKWTLFTLINAEELGVNASNVDVLASARTRNVRRLLGLDGDFGTPLGLDRQFMRNIIAAVGNYGEIFERWFGAGTGSPVLRGQNALWTEGGLLFAPPIR